MAKDTDLALDVMTQVNLTVITYLSLTDILYINQVYPTQTVYVFEESGVQLTLTVSKCDSATLMYCSPFSSLHQHLQEQTKSLHYQLLS